MARMGVLRLPRAHHALLTCAFVMMSGVCSGADDTGVETRALTGVNAPLVDPRQPAIRDATDVAGIEALARRFDDALSVLEAEGMRLVRLRMIAFDPKRDLARAEGLKKLLAAHLEVARARGTKVVLVLFPVAESAMNGRAVQTDPEKQNTYLELVMLVASWLADQPAVLAFEPMNEPPDYCKDAEKTPWLGFQEKIYATVRSKYPQMGLVLSGSCWSDVRGIRGLDPSVYRSDKRTFFTFHYYDPVEFTHQGAPFKPPIFRFLENMPFPFDPERLDMAIRSSKASIMADASLPAEQKADLVRRLDGVRRSYPQAATVERVERDFDLVERWRTTHGIERSRILLGEFGVRRNSTSLGDQPRRDAPNWLGAVALAASRRHYSWALWDYDGGSFAIVCDEKRRTVCPAYDGAIHPKP